MARTKARTKPSKPPTFADRVDADIFARFGAVRRQKIVREPIFKYVPDKASIQETNLLRWEEGPFGGVATYMVELQMREPVPQCYLFYSDLSTVSEAEARKVCQAAGWAWEGQSLVPVGCKLWFEWFRSNIGIEAHDLGLELQSAVESGMIAPYGSTQSKLSIMAPSNMSVACSLLEKVIRASAWKSKESAARLAALFETVDAVDERQRWAHQKDEE